MIDKIFADKRIQIFLAILGIVFVASILILSLRSSGSEIDEYPFEGSSQNYDVNARISNGEQLFRDIGGDRRFDQVSRDLFVFGETAYSGYRNNETEVVGFLVTKYKKQDSVIDIEGRFGVNKNKILLKITVLNNDRVATSITDDKTKLNIDTRLPSNTKLNAYIATLPQSYEGFSTDYVRTDDTITIFLNARDPGLAEVADTKLRELIDDGSYDTSRFDILFPTESVAL